MSLTKRLLLLDGTENRSSEARMSALPLPAQPVDATLALNLPHAGLLGNKRKIRLTKRPSDRLSDSSSLPAISQLRLFCRCETSPKSLISFPFKIKRCVDPLRPPSKADIGTRPCDVCFTPQKLDGVLPNSSRPCCCSRSGTWGLHSRRAVLSRSSPGRSVKSSTGVTQ